MKRLNTSREENIHQLLIFKETGDGTGFQFLGYLENVGPDMTDKFIRGIWYSRLHCIIQAGQPECEFDAAAHCADRISEAALLSTFASTDPTC